MALSMPFLAGLKSLDDVLEMLAGVELVDNPRVVPCKSSSEIACGMGPLRASSSRAGLKGTSMLLPRFFVLTFCLHSSASISLFEACDPSDAAGASLVVIEVEFVGKMSIEFEILGSSASTLPGFND